MSEAARVPVERRVARGLPAFPKIFAIGSHYISDLFQELVYIEEKVDGSQFAFGMSKGELFVRSKGRQIHIGEMNPKDMFAPAVDYVQSLILPEGMFFYCEYLRTPKHNVLAYERTPKNHLVLFGIMRADGSFIQGRETLVEWSVQLDIDVVPLLAIKTVSNPEEIQEFLETESYLGGCKIEGVVVKNYQRPFLLGGQPIPLMAGKYVSEAFKEVHRSKWKGEHTSRGKWDLFIEGHRTEARWAKAVQHLADAGKLVGEPKDIGQLIYEVKRDIDEEEREAIKTFLWREFSPDLLRRSVAGLPEWYKKTLLEKALA